MRLGLPVWLGAVVAWAAVAGAETARLDREFPAPGIELRSDSGPARAGEQLGPELIPNGGFEIWAERKVEVNPGLPGQEGLWETWRLPDGWTYRHWGGLSMTRETLLQKTHQHPVIETFESGAAHGGARSLNVGYEGMWFGSDLFRIEAGRVYALSLWVKGRNVGKGIMQKPYPLNVLLRMYADPKRETLTGVRAFHRIPKFAAELSTFDWRELRWEFTAPPGVAWATLQLAPCQARGGFELLIDDVSLRPVERQAEAWSFDAAAGFGNARLDGVALAGDALELAKPVDLAPNGGFEEGKDGAPEGWTIVKRPASANLPADEALAAALDGARRSGAWALKLGGVTGCVSAVSAPISIKEPGDYTFSVYARSSARQGGHPFGVASIAVRDIMDGTTWRKDLIQYSHGWLREKITFPSPGAQRPRLPAFKALPGYEIELSFRGAGAVWFDDARLERGATAGEPGAAYAARGEVVSEVVSVGWANSGAISWDAQVPAGRTLRIMTRTGFTPSYDAATWTGWSQPCAKPAGSPLDLAVTGAPLYLQWRAVFGSEAPASVSEADFAKSYSLVAALKEWRYAYDLDKSGLKQGFEKAGFDDAAWTAVTELKDGKLAGAPEKAPSGAVWFRTTFKLPDTVPAGRPCLFLAPSAALSYYARTTIYVDGREAADRLWGKGVWVELSGGLAPGKALTLAMRVEGEGNAAADWLAGTLLVVKGAEDAAGGATPRLKSVKVAVEGPRDRKLGFGAASITTLRNGDLRPPLSPFAARPFETYAKDVKQAALRTLAREIVGGIPVEDEDAMILALRKHLYVLNGYTGAPSAYQLPAGQNGTADILPLAVKDRLTMYCSHHWMAFTDLATAVGFVVRPVTTLNIAQHGHWADNVAEYWSNKWNKWVLVNTFFDNVWTRDGVPQSSADLMRAWFADEWDRIESRAGGDISNTFRYSAERAVGPFDWWSGLPHKHTNSQGFFTCVFVTFTPQHGRGVTLIPPDLEPLGFGQGLWTGYWPYTTDEDALYAPINQARLRLEFGDRVCRVTAEHNMPNFEAFEFRVDDGGWARAEKLPLEWRLKPGANTLRGRGVNKFGLPGPESVVMLRTLEAFEEKEPAVATPAGK